MSDTTVQFNGIQAVLKAYEYRNVPAWALFVRKQMLFTYAGDSMEEGEECLKQALEMMSDSKATYTVKVYEDLPAGAKIKDTLPCDGSFNFRLNDEPVGYAGQVGSVAFSRELQELKEQQRMIIERLDLQDGDEEGESISGVQKWLGMIQQVMSTPGVSDIVSGIVQKFVGPQRVNAIAGQLSEPVQQTDQALQAELTRVIDAYGIIRQGMPDALQLLEKLAMMYQTEPDKFAKVKSMISFAI